MKRDEVFKTKNPGDFEFNEQVAEVFDDMLRRSVPFYDAQQEMLQELSAKFWQPGSVIYDLGCSTATTLIRLAKTLDSTARLIGYDNSASMLERARANLAACNLSDRVEIRYADLNGSLDKLALDSAGLITMCWTLQFIRPMQRDNLIRHIYNALPLNGVLLVTEKVLTNRGDLNRLFIEFYYEFKRRNGYSESEILLKREALENVLIPYRIEENVELLRRNGFEIVETFFQWYNFAGFVCVKK